MNDTLHLHPEFGPLPMFIIQQNCVDSFLIPICKWENFNSKNWERLFKCNHLSQLLLSSQSWAVILLLILFWATVSWNQSQIYTILGSYIIQSTVCTCPFSAACGDALNNKTGRKQISSLLLYEKKKWFQMHVFVELPDCKLCQWQKWCPEQADS